MLITLHLLIQEILAQVMSGIVLVNKKIIRMDFLKSSLSSITWRIKFHNKNPKIVNHEYLIHPNKIKLQVLKVKFQAKTMIMNVL
jgi:hypothetical protein